MRNSRRKAMLTMSGVVAAALLSASGVAAATSEGAPNEPVQTMDCSHSHSNKDSGEGRTTTDLRYRVGPHTHCAALGLAGKNTLIYYHCFTYGDEAGGLRAWTWGRIAGTQKQGWFADAYLSDNGSTEAC
ncbi:hypothetical protein G7043_40370 [Lentzea sp. NEAU-D13]|uniref:SH3 domain-containing protein n=1 Tax=Lentzea alba TaxID=2714351 RepID=A0A7C9W395_9PSEU|nr:hypothetical protein [Lentzea alba]NGY65178.1 hypothetical protein [Lentzea alba]